MQVDLDALWQPSRAGQRSFAETATSEQLEWCSLIADGIIAREGREPIWRHLVEAWEAQWGKPPAHATLSRHIRGLVVARGG